MESVPLFGFEIEIATHLSKRSSIVDIVFPSFFRRSSVSGAFYAGYAVICPRSPMLLVSKTVCKSRDRPSLWLYLGR